MERSTILHEIYSRFLLSETEPKPEETPRERDLLWIQYSSTLLPKNQKTKLLWSSLRLLAIAFKHGIYLNPIELQTMCE